MIAAAPGVAALDRPGGQHGADQFREVDGLISAGVCEDPVGVSVGDDFETTADESVQFVADVGPETEVASYEWTDGYGEKGRGKGPGDAVLSTERSFSTTLNPGRHRITLTVETVDGRTLTDSLAVHVRGPGKGARTNVAPIADTGDCRMVVADEPTRLDGSGSYDRDGSVERYQWDLDGDGEYEATGERPTVEFSKLGNRTVELAVTDDEGATATDSVRLEVNDRPTVVAAHAPAVPNPGETVTFDAGNSSDEYGGIASYEWDLDGDGEFEATGRTVTHAFEEPGDHAVALRVTDVYGVSNVTERTVHVNHPPTADAGDSDRRANVSESLALDASASSDPEEGIVAYEWDVDGDGEFEADGRTVTHRYGTAGNRTVTLRATDDGGLTDTDTVTVKVNAPPEADAGESERRANVGETVTLDATASSDDRSIASYEWDVDGDGEFEATGRTATHRYATAGNRTVTLRVTDGWGVTDTDAVTVAVNAPPEAAVGSDRTVEVDETVTFDAGDSTDRDGEIVAYEWDVDGDGDVDATGETVEHAYGSSDTYPATLTVTDDDGATATARVDVTVLPDRIDEEGSTGLPAPPTDSVGASATGDPHLVTFDGRDYDFQAAGEYVLARSPEGSLSVQGRLVPIAERPVSVVRAVATSVDGHQVTLDAADDRPLVVDGTRHSLASTDRLAVGDGAVYRRGSRYVVVYPGADGDVDDGDERLVVDYRGDRLDVRLTLRSDRKHGVEGLLGTPAGGAPDVALPDGTPVSPTEYDELYGTFRDDWRVNDTAESQFHYESGESPDAFYDPDYPGRLFGVEDLSDERRSAAEQAALEAGLERGTAAFENAVLDYALTGDESYLTSAAASRPANATFALDAGSSFEATPGDAVPFVATVRNATTDDVAVEWRFGDGTTATGTRVGHAFDSTGTYTVTVTATGPDGGVARDTLTVTVAENATTSQSPVVDVAVTRPNATHVRLDAGGSTDPDGTVEGYAWDTDGDGAVDAYGRTTTFAVGPESTEVTVSAIDDDGRTGTLTVPINAPPVATLTGPSEVTRGEAATFDASGSSDADGDALTYDYDWTSDGTYDCLSCGPSASHAYSTTGSETVTVRVTDAEGETDTASYATGVTSATEAFDGFEDPSTWSTTTDGRFEGPAYNGSLAGEAVDTTDNWKWYFKKRFFGGGKRPDTFEVYFRETSSNNRAGLSLLNSNGDVEVRIGTNNPQWLVEDGDGRTTVYEGDGYRRWIHVELTFDWQAGTYTYRFEDLRSGHVETGTRPLKHGVDVETVRMDDFGCETDYYWQDWCSTYIWWDDVQFD